MRGFYVTRFAARSLACVGEVSFCSHFFVSFGTSHIWCLRIQHPCGGRSQVPFSILVSCCFLYVSRSECPTLPSLSISSGFCGGALTSVIVLLPIISACVSCGSSVSTIMPVRLSSICMSSPLPFDVCDFPFNVVSTVVVCTRWASFLLRRLDGPSFGLLGGTICFVAVMFCADSVCGCIVLCVTTSAHGGWDCLFCWLFICRRLGHSWYWWPMSLHP